MGFDVTDFLDHEISRTPVTLYLFHLVRHLLDGRRLVCWMDEFWRLLADPAFESFAKDGPKTWRKLNGVMALATQSASDVLAARSAARSSSRPRPRSSSRMRMRMREDYCEGFGLTEREFRLIKEELEPGSRRFLVKQGHQSVVCELDLKGFDAELAVISGRRSAVDVVQSSSSRVTARIRAVVAAVLRAGAAVSPLLINRRRCPMFPRVILSFVLAGGSSDSRRSPARARAVRGHRCRLHRATGAGSTELEQQLATARSQLAQAQSEYAAITGTRGMQNLLCRHEPQLPADRLDAALAGA